MALVSSRLSATLLLFTVLCNPNCVNSFVSNPRVEYVGPDDVKFTEKRANRLLAVSFPLPSPRSSTRAVTSTSLGASISPVAWSAIGSVLGGTTGVPVVSKAINSWYRKIDLPPWTPPDRVFAPTWTFLYAIMGVAAGRVYQRVGNSLPILLWVCHYLVNLSWAPVFFGRKRLRLGLWMNVCLVTSLGVIIPLFYRIDALSGKLLLPYMVWLVFATALNASICKRNPTPADGYNNAKFQSDLAGLQDQAASYAGV